MLKYFFLFVKEYGYYCLRYNKTFTHNFSEQKMKVVLMGMFFLLEGVHSSCFRHKEGENSSWEWSQKIGYMTEDVVSLGDCQKLCVNDYDCVAMTYKVRLLDRVH